MRLLISFPDAFLWELDGIGQGQWDGMEGNSAKLND